MEENKIADEERSWAEKNIKIGNVCARIALQLLSMGQNQLPWYRQTVATVPGKQKTKNKKRARFIAEESVASRIFQ